MAKNKNKKDIEQGYEPDIEQYEKIAEAESEENLPETPKGMAGTLGHEDDIMINPDGERIEKEEALQEIAENDEQSNTEIELDNPIRQ